MNNKQQRYEALIRSYHADLYRYACWLCQHKAVAEDLLQETFLRAWKHLDSLHDVNAAKSWLITILRRENARRFERKQFEYEDIAQDGLVDEQTTNPEQQTEQRWIRQHILQLHDDYREPLLLQLIFGMTGEEIALTLALNLNTVNTRLFRARQQLKEQLQSASKGVSQHG